MSQKLANPLFWWFFCAGIILQQTIIDSFETPDSFTDVLHVLQVRPTVPQDQELKTLPSESTHLKVPWVRTSSLEQSRVGVEYFNEGFRIPSTRDGSKADR